MPTDPLLPAREVEDRHVEILTTVQAVVSVPVAVKLSPYFSSIGEMALRLDQAGADGLVLFNRFLQPDIDPETLTVTAGFGLSSPSEGRLPRAWIALLARRVRASLAATTGVETAADVARYLLAGADVVMTASALLRHSPAYAGVLLDELADWMTRKGFGSVAEYRGMLSVPAGTDQAAYERSGYVTTLEAANTHHGPW
jgi:dihydroorotate dehydrogenase (fumarate)